MCSRIGGPVLLLSLFSCWAAKEKKEARGPKMVKIPARKVVLGGDGWGTKEFAIQAYWIDETPVTNKDFRAFVKDTRFKTEAESFGWSFVLNSTLSEATLQEADQWVEAAPWWIAVQGAYWRQPEGRDSNLKGRMEEYPATHISGNDAKAYCKWAGKRMPTEAEWENAARGKRKESLYPWDDGTNPMGKKGDWMMNVWQGDFPRENLAWDGYHGVAPVRAFPANSYGLYSTVGNIWEWVSDHFRSQNPQEKQLTLKGGSFIDSIDGKWNHKASVVTRMGNTADAGSQNIGFRCAKGKGGGGRAAPPDQEKMMKILEEGGVEALQEHVGSSSVIMTPRQLQERQERMKEAMRDGGGQQEL